MQQLYYTLSGGTTWTTVALPGPYPFDLDIHPSNPARAVFASAFAVTLCENYGASCSSIGMPSATLNTAYRWIRFSPDGAEVWTGTDFGVFMTPDLGVTWRRVGHNLPLTEVLDLKYKNNRWLASNHQGVWELRTDSTGEPSTPVVTVAVIPGAIRVDWAAIAGAQDYQVYRDGLQVFQGTSGDLLFPDRSVVAGTRYCYRVSAYNYAGFSKRSTEQCMTFNAVAGDTTPNAYAFTNVSNAFLGREVTSNSVTLTGIDAPTVITATGGTYSIGCGATFTASPGLVTNNQTVCVRHTVAATGSGTTVTTLTVGGVQSTFTSTSAASNVRAQIASFYRTILRREADSAGLGFWDGEAARLVALGVNLNETWYAMSGSFFTSAEYLALARNDTGFVTDLYNTFFNRAPDAGGLDYWTGQLAAGLPREVVLVAFMFSSEFTTFTQAIFGNVAVRRELDTVVDFYRGLLARLPDDGGFNFWVGRFRAAQCSGGPAVLAEAESISSGYIASSEYTGRNRSNTQHVSDLYNAFLRRGGDLAGVQYWIAQIATAARTRDNVRREFMASPEFNARVQAIIAQGCIS